MPQNVATLYPIRKQMLARKLVNVQATHLHLTLNDLVDKRVAGRAD